MAKWGEVIDVTEITRPDETGEIQTYYRYRARSKGGIVFTELISEGLATPEEVNLALEEKAIRLDKTKAL